MVHRCCISSCGMNVRVPEAKGLSYHGFPIKEPLREQWVQAIIPYLDKPECFRVVQKYTRVCSRHFRKKDYSVDIKKRARLNSNAVPSVFPRKNSPIIIPNVLSSPSRSIAAATVASSSSSLYSSKPPAPFLHHSSEESIFSTEEEESHPNHQKVYVAPSNNPSYQRCPSPDGTSSMSNLSLSQVGPSQLEIENLAHHLNTSLFTGYSSVDTGTTINLSIGLEDLHLPERDIEDSSTASSSSEDIHNLFLHEPKQKQKRSSRPNTTIITTTRKQNNQNNNYKKSSPEKNVRLTGVTKKHKKEKICGQFSVERFSNSDKDIEYYTGFSSYRNFEAFFRSLEAYVERLRVTDVMFGVANLDKLKHSDILGIGTDGSGLDYNDHHHTCCSTTLTDKTLLSSSLPSTTASSSSEPEFILPLPPPPLPAYDEPIKRRPFHGRSMSRIDELFMTIIRLKRKLPEKVLGHMFCTSQPTVSRIIRAWTVLLSKLIDCYPVEGGNGSKGSKSSSSSSSEHSYTSRGLGIPESFRQLFHSELAQSIVVTSVTVSAKTKKPVSSTLTSSSSSSSSAFGYDFDSSSSSTAKRLKKSRVVVDEEEQIEFPTIVSLSSSCGVNEQDCGDGSSDLLDASSNLLFSSTQLGLEVEECEIFQPLSFLD